MSTWATDAAAPALAATEGEAGGEAAGALVVEGAVFAVVVTTAAWGAVWVSPPAPL